MSRALADDLDDPTEDEASSSWLPVDLGPYIDGTITRPEPGLLYRTDGVGLLYPGKVHWCHGESESGKSWVAQIATVAVLARGGTVLYLDHESDPQDVVARLLALGADGAALRSQLAYVRPEETWMQTKNTGAFEGLLGRRFTLGIVDGVTDALGLDQLSTNDTDEVARWVRKVPRRIARETGAAVVAVDHVSKSTDSRGRFAIGSQAKMAGLDGAAFVVEPDKPLGMGLVGEIALRVAKDRPGSLRRHGGTYHKGDRTQEIARITHDAQNPYRIVVTIGSPQARGTEHDGPAPAFRPTGLMEKVSHALESHPEGLSSTRVQQLVTGKKDYIAVALDVLVTEGWVSRTKTSRGNATTYSHVSHTAYREAGDANTNLPNSRDPATGSDRVPGPGSKTRGPGGPGDRTGHPTGSGTWWGPGGDPVDQRKQRDPAKDHPPGPEDRGPGDDDDVDRWVRANLIRTPQPVGTIAAQAQTDTSLVQAALNRLHEQGTVTRHPATTGPVTWSLPPKQHNSEDHDE